MKNNRIIIKEYDMKLIDRLMMEFDKMEEAKIPQDKIRLYLSLAKELILLEEQRNISS